MWSVPTRKSQWPKLTTLEPAHILDEYDGPRLFTVRSAEGDLLLAYACGDGANVERFLLVPTDDALVSAIESNKLSLQDALTGRGWAWLVDRERDGTITQLGAVENISGLPQTALPRPGVRLYRGPDVLLRVKMSGDRLTPEHVPASVVKRAVDGTMGAVRTLVNHALRGQPKAFLRRYYDLPAVEFAFKSFEIAFGRPDPPDPVRDEKGTIDRVCKLLSKGLEWAIAEMETEPEKTSEWSAIAEALEKLAPPLRGDIKTVEVSGRLASQSQKVICLTRAASERIGNARKFLVPTITAASTDSAVGGTGVPTITAASTDSAVGGTRTYTGLVRGFDKDELTFILRDLEGKTIRAISFSRNQYDDALVAFNSESPVTVVFETPASAIAELVSITSIAPPEGGDPPPSGVL
jgi:hypothetical protein